MNFCNLCASCLICVITDLIIYQSAFWTLDMLMRDYYMEGFFGEKIINLNRALNQFALLIEAMLPEIHEHFVSSIDDPASENYKNGNFFGHASALNYFAK